MACFTRQEAKDLWDFAKENYLKQPIPGKGFLDFKTLTNLLSDDIYRATGGDTLGANGKPMGRRIVPEDIAKLLATPKTLLRQRKNLLLTDRNRSGALR